MPGDRKKAVGKKKLRLGVRNSWVLVWSQLFASWVITLLNLSVFHF
jgi:hypothetical protein